MICNHTASAATLLLKQNEANGKYSGAWNSNKKWEYTTVCYVWPLNSSTQMLWRMLLISPVQHVPTLSEKETWLISISYMCVPPHIVKNFSWIRFKVMQVLLYILILEWEVGFLFCQSNHLYVKGENFSILVFKQQKALSQSFKKQRAKCEINLFTGKHSTNFVSRYDPRFNSWIQLPPMQER